ncbi:hypothetical protein WOLCODRAFT_142515 [Wolfiporia cocos MD-104 SS10]|uniref:Uncharacterized protein n=1 Tax=Wolfiporia cocos (strain MD-104) TaxID=742152 RepID=A0A2H3JEV6_WOLCO|nr:hypothetical protein WOLCODRAFT_142515 [Wolfiporia cocos MD-104 SS10]
MSFIYSVARVCAYTLMLVMNGMLVSLYILSLKRHSGGPYEISCVVIHAGVIGVLVVQACHTMYRRVFRREDKPAPQLIYVGILMFLSLLGSIVIAVRAAQRPGLAGDFTALSDPISAAVSVLAISWLLTLLSGLIILINYLDNYPGADSGATEDTGTPLTSLPVRHRVVFHENHRPLKVIEVARDNSTSVWARPQQPIRYPCAPEPTHIRWNEGQPRSLRTTCNPWQSRASSRSI